MMKNKSGIGTIIAATGTLLIGCAITATAISVWSTAYYTRLSNELLNELVKRRPTVIVVSEKADSSAEKIEETPVEITSAEEVTAVEDDEPVLYYEPELADAKDGKSLGEDMVLPDLPTDRKVCTDYRFYNVPGTPHNRMQLAAWTDEQGCRRYGDYYIVGLGSAYSNQVGETFEVELDTGVVFRIITGDMKPDDDTDVTNRFEACYNYDGEYCANVLEFIMDKEVISRSAYEWGGVDYYDNFKGNIVRMTYLGRDTSADWDIYT